MDDLKIAAAYIRVSTDDQTELSPDSQIKVVREFAKQKGYLISFVMTVSPVERQVSDLSLTI